MSLVFARSVFIFYPRQTPTSCVIRGLFTSTRRTVRDRLLAGA
ncbi:hypothetical protein C4K25_3333 [Pseudomonas chlororaphis]|nr:hypothetical protein C4K25_3333 [Pseudomonas chlororaphis]